MRGSPAGTDQFLGFAGWAFSNIHRETSPCIDLSERISALSSLETAVDKGFGFKDWLEHDTDLDSIRATPRFQAIAQAM